MSDLQVYAYMWDNRTLWGIDYPNRPSVVWLIQGIFTLLMVLGSFSLNRGYLLFAFQGLTLVSSLLQLAIGLQSYLKIEPKRLLNFKIDEIGLQINHYFKRKQALLSPLGLALLTVILIRTGVLCAISRSG